MIRFALFSIGVASLVALPANAQTAAPAAVDTTPHMAPGLTLITPQEADFKPVPGAPSCMQMAGLRGDPSRQAATFMTRLDPGCIAPFHWHSATEETVMLAGNAITHMRGMAPQRLPTSSYSQFPAHHIHRFKCLESAPCYILTIADAPFDIHWVDRTGKEIDFAQASADAATDPTPWDH